MRNTQILMLGGVAMPVAALFTTMSLHNILAQESGNSTSQSNQMRTGIPQLNGSVNIEQQANQFIQGNLRVPFATALETAQAEVQNGTAISGHIGVVQGYLVYTFKVANFNTETSRIVVVDAGNGAVLYTSQDIPLHYGGLGGYGCGGDHKGFAMGWGNHFRDRPLDNNNPTHGESVPSSGMVASPALGV